MWQSRRRTTVFVLRRRRVANRIAKRIEELETLPVVMADDLKTSAMTELRALRLLNFQRQVSELAKFMWFRWIPRMLQLFELKRKNVFLCLHLFTFALRRSYRLTCIMDQ